MCFFCVLQASRERNSILIYATIGATKCIHTINTGLCILVLNVDKSLCNWRKSFCPSQNPSNVGVEIQHKVIELSAGLVQILKDVQMKIIYEHTISLSSNKCVFLNTSLGRKYHPILEGGNGCDVGTWKSNHKGRL